MEQREDHIMNDHDSLKNRVKTVITECESLMDCFDTLLQASQKGKSAQLKEIEKTIDNMQKKGLTIPPELRKLKLDLLSDLDAAETQIVLKSELIENMHRIFSIKPPEVKNGEHKKNRQRTMVRRSNNYPPDGTLCKFVYKNQRYNGEIKDSRLVIEGYGLFSSFSSASVEITQTSRNGWRDWELLIPGSNHWVLADLWRKKIK